MPHQPSPPAASTVDVLESAREILRLEADAVRGLIERVDERFAAAVEMILQCRGRIVVTGMGKAGIIGHKIQATLASTGTPAIFMHPAEATHGDLGMLLADDVVLALSNSGEGDELVRLLPHIKRIGANVIAITASAESTLGRESDVTLELGRIEEACPIRLAPSASTTAMLALGDALALTLLSLRDFTPAQYAQFHPGGELGRKPPFVCNLMRTGERCPLATADENLGDVLGRMTRARAGCVSVVDGDDRMIGVFTDGDFRRLVADGLGADELQQPIDRAMTRGGLRIHCEKLVAEAMGVFQAKKINALPVVDDDDVVVGLLDVQDIVGLRIEP